jgi:signal transduction histidine kinase
VLVRLGHGLGLFVVKQIVEASGGAIEIASVPGEGTTFTLRIPSAPQPFQESLRAPLTVATRNGA